MEYWTIIDDRHAGPFSADELMAQGLTLDTPVWVSGLPDWVEAREIPELRALLEAAPTDEAQAPADILYEEEVIEEEISVEPQQPQQPQPQPQANEEPQEFPHPYQPMNGQQPYQPMNGQQPYQPNHPIGGGQQPQQPWQPQQPQQPWQPQQPMGGGQQPPQPQWEWQREPQPIPEGAEIPPAYLAWSIIVTILCCVPLGIPAIIFSAKTRSAIARGDLEAARKSSNTAQWCIILAIVLGLISMPLQIIFSGV